MGLSTIAAVLILFIAALTIGIVTYGTLESDFRELARAITGQNELMKEQRLTSIVIFASTEGNCTLYNLTIGITNTGSYVIDAGRLTLLDNNAFLNNTITVALPPTKYINITFNDMTTAQEGHTVKAVTGNGIPAYVAYNCTPG